MTSEGASTGHDQAPFPVEPDVMAVLEELWSKGHGAYLVGGGVRDALLGLPTTDWDVATDAPPERILEIFPGSTYQNRFGTVLARGLEITTFRRDHRYADHRRPERVTFSEDVYEDLARRDLTINAIAWGRRGPDASARLLDPADGAGDLKARLVRAVGDPARRFDEDALRLLRAVRIAARLDFTIEPMTHAAMTAHAADIAWVSEERIGAEIRRMLGAQTPSRAFHLMAETNILAATLPELAALDRQGRADDGRTKLAHSLDVLDGAAAIPAAPESLHFATLLHELDTDPAQAILERLRVAGRDIDVVCRLIALSPDDYEPSWSDADVRRLMRRVGEDLLDDLLRLRRIHAAVVGNPDAVTHNEELRVRVEAQRTAGSPLSRSQLAIDGADLRETLGIPEGPAIGLILDRLLEDVVDDPLLDRRSTLLTRASMILDELVEEGRASTDAADQPGRPDRVGRPGIR